MADPRIHHPPVRIDRVVLRITGMNETDARSLAAAAVERLTAGPGPLSAVDGAGATPAHLQARISAAPGANPQVLAQTAANHVWRGIGSNTP